MLISLGFGLVAAVGISQVMGRNSGTGEGKVSLVPVVVAVDFLDHDAELNEKTVRVENWPAAIVPENSARSLEEIKNKAVTTRINKGNPISLADLIDVSQIQKIAIPAGYKVIGIKVNADDVVSGLVKPGDYVDLIGVFESNKTGGGESTTTSKTFMKNIRVFSVNGTTQKEAGPRKASGSGGESILSLLVTPKKAEQIVLVQRVASLRVVLGDGSSSNLEALANDSDTDTENMDQSGLTDLIPGLSNLLGNAKPTEPSVQPIVQPSKPSSPAFVATYWNGSEAVKVNFDKNGQIIPRDDTGATSAMRSASEAFQKQSMEQAKEAGSDGSEDVKSSDSSESDNDSEEDQYPKQ
jgi:pilus assembly protein CpaB